MKTKFRILILLLFVFYQIPGISQNTITPESLHSCLENAIDLINLKLYQGLQYDKIKAVKPGKDFDEIDINQLSNRREAVNNSSSNFINQPQGHSAQIIYEKTIDSNTFEISYLPKYYSPGLVVGNPMGKELVPYYFVNLEHVYRVISNHDSLILSSLVWARSVYDHLSFKTQVENSNRFYNSTVAGSIWTANLPSNYHTLKLDKKFTEFIALSLFNSIKRMSFHASLREDQLFRNSALTIAYTNLQHQLFDSTKQWIVNPYNPNDPYDRVLAGISFEYFNQISVSQIGTDYAFELSMSNRPKFKAYFSFNQNANSIAWYDYVLLREYVVQFE